MKSLTDRYNDWKQYAQHGYGLLSADAFQEIQTASRWTINRRLQLIGLSNRKIKAILDYRCEKHQRFKIPASMTGTRLERETVQSLTLLVGRVYTARLTGLTVGRVKYIQELTRTPAIRSAIQRERNLSQILDPQPMTEKGAGHVTK